MKIIRTSTIPVSLSVLLNGQLKFLNQYFEIEAISSSGSYLDLVSQREGVATFGIDMERGISPVKDILSLYHLYVHFKKESPSIVHSITPKAGLLSMLAAKFAGVPIRMHTFTGLIFPAKTGLTKKILIAMDRLLCWAATNVYPEGNGVKNDLINYRITPKPLKVLANGNVNGIDVHYFSEAQVFHKQKNNLKKELNIGANDFVFVFIGRLVKDKGINELVDAFCKLAEKRELNTEKESSSKIKLLLVGPEEQELSPLLPETLEMIRNNSDIISVGFQQDVRPYFAISDALVFPSYREGFPNVVMQAGAMGLPSIVTDINGCNEIIIHDKNGVIIPPKDENALLEAMNYFLNYPDEIQRMAANARPLIMERYEQWKVWEALLEEYRSLLQV